MSESRSRSWWKKWGLVIVVVIFAAAWLGLASALRNREMRLRLVCASRLKGFGTVAKIHANESVQQPAPSLDDVVQGLIQLGYLSPEQTVCPRSKKPYVLNPLPAATSGLAEPAGLDSRYVIAYEPLSYHGGEGANVLYADGHASFERAASFHKLIDEGWINTNGCVRAR